MIVPAKSSRVLVWLSLMVFAVFVFATARRGALAQERNDQAKAGANAAESTMGNGATTKVDDRKTQPGTRASKGKAIPEPAVVLSPGQKPIIEFDSLVYDFGRIRAGTRVAHDFTFTNTGNGTLEILKVKTG